MKRWPVLLAITLLAGTNGLTLWCLARSMATRTSQQEEIRRLELRIGTTEKIAANWRQVRAADRVSDALIRAAEITQTWQRLYEDCDRPLAMGDRIDGALVCRVDSSGVYTLDISREVRREIRDLPAGLRCRAALGVALAAE